MNWAVENSSPDNVLIVAGRFGNPMVLRVTLGLTKDAVPFVKAVKTYPVEKGMLLEISYAKILRSAIDCVSYVFREPATPLWLLSHIYFIHYIYM
jgi:hypothetical protein